LSNDGKTPIVYSISCWNNDISHSDCIGEEWVQATGKGAVAHYGASCPSYTLPNHDLDEYLFKATYDKKICKLGPVVNWAQKKTIILWGGQKSPPTLAEKNAWIYLLLGDPEMYIRTSRKWFWPFDKHYIMHKEPFVGNVLDSLGDPVKDALVTLYDAETDSNPNCFTDNSGMFAVSFPYALEADSVILCVTEPDFEPLMDTLVVVERGDANGNREVTIADAVYLVNYLFRGGDPPTPVLAVGDCTCEQEVTVADVVFLISYLFRGGPEPYCG